MRIAYTPAAYEVRAADAVALTVEAERLGYDSAWLAEVSGPESFALAAAIATRTERLDLGVAVVPATTRTPALLAMGAATISQVASGRKFTLGIGASSQVIVEHWHGRTFDRPLTQVREAVEATRAALAGRRGYQGEFASMDRFRLASEPAGPVPVFVGALGPRMLRLAGAVGDGVCLNLMPPSMVPRQRAEIAAGAAAAGRDLPEEFGVMARLHTVVTDDLAAGRSAVRRGFGPYFAQPVYNRFLAWCGYPEEAQAIAEAWATGDREALAAALHDRVVDSLALIGTPAAVRERLEAYAAVGITVAALNFLAPGRDRAAAAMLALAPRQG